MSSKNKKVYDLEYIEKIFKVIPLTFILILSMVSIFVTFVILESKQNREIDLLKQKTQLQNQFEKKEVLLDFSKNVENRVTNELNKISKILQEHAHKIIGNLNNKDELKFDSTVHFLEEYERNHGVEIVLFENKPLNIVYGHDKIVFLSKLIFGDYTEVYKQIVLKYISSQGRYNLQEWKNDLTGALRLSFFDTFEINNKKYYVGTFSKLENIRYITKNLIIDEIDSSNKTDKYTIWFYDLITRLTYNYQNKKLFDNINVVLSKKDYSKKFEILKYFDDNEQMNENFSNYILYNNRFKYFIAIDYNKDVEINELEIRDKYKALYSEITTYIVFIGLLLIISSLLFSNFTKKILDRYNNMLNEKTKLLTHWKNRFELAIIASNDGLWDIDFNTNEIYFSDKWLEISGYQRGEVKKFSDWFSLIHNKDKDAVKYLFDEIFEEKRDNFICEYRLRVKSGNFKWILARGKLFIDKDTGHKRMLMMSMDIDKNKRLKKELLDVELLVEDGKIVIFKLFNDENLSVKYISNSIKNYGFTKKSFETNEMNFLDLFYKKDIDIIKAAMNAAINKNLSDFTFECRVLNAANQIRWVSCRVILLKDHSGNLANFYGYMSDITKIKLSEEELKNKINEELDKNREKDRILIQQSKLAAMGEMLGNIAHQWRQPLNNISLFLSFIKDGYKNEKITFEMLEKYFDKSFNQIEYMSQTIDDFRNFYKPSKQKNRFDIKHAIDSTIEIIKAQIKDENINLRLNVSENILYGFENELKQSLLNIFNNALDAIKSKSKEKDFEKYIKVDSKEEKGFIKIKIENNGGKINEEIISKIFEPYFTTKFESQGTGIGLYMTKSIIETNMNGKIEVENIEEGVVFTIKLPILEGNENE